VSRYRVVGPHAVLDTAPGDVIDQEMPRLQAVQLVSGGFIVEVTDEPSSTANEEAPATAAENPTEGD
jgi:hypothetical protein